jgi:uncharacterized protein involved in exopolysaccharide biosynthesis
MNLVVQIIRQLAKKWYLWVFVPLFCVLIVFFLTGKSPKQYESKATLFLNLPTNGGLSITNEGYKQHEISAYIQDLIQLTNSSKAMERVRLTILKDYLQGQNDFFQVDSTAFPKADSADVVHRIDSLLTNNQMLDVYHELDAAITIFFRDNGMTNDAIKSLFKIYREGSSNYLRLIVTTSNPYHSAYIGKKVTETMLYLNKDINQGKLIADQRLFEKLVQQAKKELDEKVENLERYKIRNNVINLPEHTKAIVNQMVQLEVQKAELLESLASKQEGIVQLRNKLGVVDEIPVDLSKNGRFIELQNEMRGLRSSTLSTGNGFNLQQSKAISDEFDRLMAEYVSEVPIDIRRTRQELIQQYLNYQIEVEMNRQLIPIVDAEIQRINDYARKFAPLESSIGTLEREITTAQETYLILVNKLNLAKTVAQATGENELVLIDSPNVPLNPVSTKRKILILLSAALSFVVIIFLIAAVEFLDAGLWSARDFESVFGLAPDAVLPRTDKLNREPDPSLKAYLKTVSREQARSMAIRIDDMLDGGSGLLIVLSATNNEGKSKVIAALTYALNRMGYGVAAHKRIADGPEMEFISTMPEEKAVVEILELPPYSIFTDWEEFLKGDALFMPVFHAGRAALKCDHKVLEKLPKGQTLSILNNVDTDYMEDSGNQVVRRRSVLRIWVKRLITLQFKAKSINLSS